MIQALQNLDDSIKVWRQMIIKQSRQNGNRVLNGMSIRGVSLSKKITELVSTSIDVKDCIIIFTMHNRYDDTDISQEADELESVVNLELKLTIYGDSSLDVSTRLKARLESAKCRSDLYAAGINLQKISSVEEINEFLNETAWHRCDMSIDYAVVLKSDEIDKDYDFESIDLNVDAPQPYVLTDYNATINLHMISSDDFLIDEHMLVIS